MLNEDFLLWGRGAAWAVPHVGETRVRLVGAKRVQHSIQQRVHISQVPSRLTELYSITHVQIHSFA